MVLTFKKQSKQYHRTNFIISFKSAFKNVPLEKNETVILEYE